MRTRGLLAALLVLLLDQASKLAILNHLGDGEGMVRITGFLNLALVSNHGITFGFFNRSGAFNAMIFSLLALGITGALIVWLGRTRSGLVAIAMGMVIGGAIGNLIDRLRLGAVVDFLDFHIGGLHWYVFNVADAGICIGVGLLLLDGLLLRTESPK